MAKMSITNDAGTTEYASITFPDSALPKMRTVYSGTNAQAAAKALRTAVQAIRTEVRNGLEANEREAANATLSATLATVLTTFEVTDWPPQ